MAGKSRQRSGGFTLVELMIVVAIIGVLAAVAIPSFENYQLTSKRTEAFANLSALAKAQKSYFAEFNEFVPSPAQPGTDLGAVPSNQKRDKAPISTSFEAVGWVPDGDVFFDYDTATPVDPGAGTCTCVEACFTATAYGDLDEDGTISALMYAHADAAGDFCESGLAGLLPPINGLGARIFNEVARVTLADDF
jgi:type IV pilus assembly protein PilA